MPELPEVEITRENVASWLSGRTVTRVRVLDARMLRGQSARTFARAVNGARVGEVRRRAKYLVLDLPERRVELLIHLGMAGKLLLQERGARTAPAARVVFRRDDGARIIFRDPRVFGRIQAFGAGEIEALPEIARLGPEPLSRSFTAARLGRALTGSRRPVKVLLLDQTRIAGLGNIHAAESLFRAKIHPASPAGDLSDALVARLWKAIRAQLRETIRRDRSPEIVYVEERGAPNPFRVYGRKGEPCPDCAAPIARIVQAQRSTYFCPACQPDLVA